MNVHFLELFYYVARHGGISAAARKVPYGIQQPAISTQMRNLESDLRVTLFERTPFRLTAAGRLLFAHIEPFFEGMSAVVARVREAEEPQLSVGAAEQVLRDHLPLVLKRVKAEFPRLRVSLRSLGFQAEAEAWLKRGQLDLAFLPLRPRPSKGFSQRPMLRLPLVLLAPTHSEIRSIEELFQRRRLAWPLISLPETSQVSLAFQQGLKRLGVHWPQTVEAGSLDIVARCVAHGDGFGVGIEVNRRQRLRGIRAWPLPRFAPVTLGAIWQRALSPQALAVVDLVHGYARQTWPDQAVDGTP